MAYQKLKNEHNLPVVAATIILPKQPLKFAGTSVLLAAPCATNSDRPHWFSGAATFLTGEAVAANEAGQIVKAVAAASVGAGAEVGVASSNGALSPAALIAASGHWAVGVSLTPALAGEIFSVDIRPRKV